MKTLLKTILLSTLLVASFGSSAWAAEDAAAAPAAKVGQQDSPPNGCSEIYDGTGDKSVAATVPGANATDPATKDAGTGD